jgi:phage-related protein
MEENLNNKPQRPTFLTVLCILTFIGSAFGIFSGITNVMSASTAAALMDPIKTEMDKELNKAKESIYENNEEMIEESMDDQEYDETDADSLSDSSKIETKVDDLEKAVEDKVLGKVQETMGNALASINEETIKNNGYAAIIASILTLMGAFFMWGLKKMGFLIYVFGTLVGIVAPIIIYNGNIVGAISAIGMGFVGLIFIVLYALNRKHLVY